MDDGALIAELLMASYMAAENGKKLKFPPKGNKDFVPKLRREHRIPKARRRHCLNSNALCPCEARFRKR